MKKYLATLVFCMFLLLSISAVEATPINGSIAFSGIATPLGGLLWGTATGVDFGAASVMTSKGDLAGFGYLTAATFKDFNFAPALSPDPVVAFWTTNTGATIAQFTLKTITIVKQSTVPADSLELFGTGTLSLTGFDDTEGLFSFTGQNLGGSFSFSASSASVPEPGILVLLGSGLIGVASTFHRRLR